MDASNLPTLIALSLITLGGIALRGYGLGSKSLWYDEAVLYWISQGGISEILEQNAVLNSAPPLFPLLIALLSKIGHSEAVLRSLPCVAGALSVPAMYALGRRFLSRWGALVAAFILAIAPSHIEPSQDLREYSLTVLLAILLLLATDIYLETRTWKSVLVVAVLILFGVVLQYGLALFILALDAVMFVRILVPRRAPQADWLKWGVLQSVILAASFSVYLLSLRAQWQPGGFGAGGHLAGAYWDAHAETMLGFLVRQTKDIIDLAFPGSVFLLVVYVGAVVWASSADAWLDALYVGVPFVVFAAAGVGGLYPYHAGRQDLLLTPLLYLVVALGLDHLMRIDPKKVVPMLFVALLARKASQELPGYFSSPGREATGSLVKHLQLVVEPGDPVFVCKEDPAFRYYFHVRYPIEGSPLIVANQDPVSGPLENENTLDGVLERDGRVWMVILRCDDMDRLLGQIAQSWTLELVTEATPDAWLYLAHQE